MDLLVLLAAESKESRILPPNFENQGFENIFGVGSSQIIPQTHNARNQKPCSQKIDT